MAATTTAKNACNVAIWLDNDAGSPTDISGSLNKAGVRPTQKIGEFEVFQYEWTKRLCCGRDVEFQLSIVYTTAAAEGWDVVKDWIYGNTPCTKRTLSIYVPDKNVGSDHFSAEVIWVEAPMVLDRGDPGPIMIEMILKPDGIVNHSVTTT